MEQKSHKTPILQNFLKKDQPIAAIVLGSGWSTVISRFKIIRSLQYSAIPGLGATSIKGHAGKVHLADAGSTSMLIFEGRRHYYEGDGWAPIRTLVSICVNACIKHLILTNAAGGISRRLKPGSLMLITDHINSMGSNPLIGPHDAFWGERFPDQTAIYNRDLAKLFISTARSKHIPLAQGTYLATTGPTYETPAEISAFGKLGADAVGMSTVPEAILANAAGIRVAGLSCITNLAAGVSKHPLSHEEVIRTASGMQNNMSELLFGVCSALK